MTNIDVSQEDICALFGPRFDKNKWKYKSQTIVEFQGIIKSLYNCVFRKSHVLNETLSLEFAHGVVAENKWIEVNWATYTYLVYKKQQTLEKSRKTKKIKFVKLQEFLRQTLGPNNLFVHFVPPSIPG